MMSTAESKPRAKMPFADKVVIWIAEGLGTGRIPFAPGTWGTALGFIWIAILMLPRSLPIYCAGTALGFFGAVYVGGRAEKILNEKDPNRIVIDEIAALPLAFLGCLLVAGSDMPHFLTFLRPEKWHLSIAAFLLFRIFDVLKPLGIYHSQKLPGGWGLVVDDFLAALLVTPLVALLASWKP